MLMRRSPRLGATHASSVELTAAAVLALALVSALTAVSALVGPSTAFLGAAGLLVCLFLIFNPRLEISLAILALYLGLFDGYLKLSTGNPLATGVRDLLLYSIVAGALLRLAISQRSVRLPKYTAHVVLLVAIVVAQAFNPETPNAAAAFGGMRQHLEFVPLLFFGYAIMRTERRLKAFLAILIVIVVANSIVAVMQYRLTPNAFAAWGPGYARAVLGTGAFEGGARVFGDAGGGVYVRPFGLGSDTGASGLLGWMALGAALALIASRSGVRTAAVGVVGVVFCAIGIIASQARSTVFAAAFALIAFLALTVTARQAVRGIVALTLAGLIIYGGTATFLSLQHGAANRFDTLRNKSLVQVVRDNRGRSAGLIPEYAVRYPLGVGLGRAGPAGGFLSQESGLDAENEPNLLIEELGTVGLIVFATLWLRVLVDGIRLVRRTPDLTARLYLAALVAPLVAMTPVWFASSPTTAPPTSPYFWFAAGVIAHAATPGSPGLRIRSMTRAVE